MKMRVHRRTIEAAQRDDGYAGYIEPDVKHPPWIVFFYDDGTAIAYGAREESGAVEGKPFAMRGYTVSKGSFCECGRDLQGLASSPQHDGCARCLPDD